MATAALADSSDARQAPTHLEAPNSHTNGEPRGIKRSRTPDPGNGVQGVDDSDDDDDLPRKRGRSSRPSRQPSPLPAKGASNSPARTPKSHNQSLPRESPSKPSQNGATPAKAPAKVITPITNITTDQLSEDRSGYIESAWDSEGDKKVTDTGHLTGGRAYRCRTFHLPDRGHKLFMLATECARVLVFRDSYLLFNKNKSLHKIIATISDKEGLIEQEILPYSYRSRQIALVLARSMYRQFGAKMIADGRRVRDDYWEEQARAQGFTEDDFAVEKKVEKVEKPKQPKEGTGNDVSSIGATAMNTLAQGSIIYQKTDSANDPPLLNADVTPDGISKAGDYGNIARPRQDITGQPYEDRIQPSIEKEIIDQAAQAAQFNQACQEQSRNRRQYFQEYYLKPREVKQAEPPPPAASQPPEPLPQNLPPPYQQSPQRRRESQPPPPAYSQQQPQTHPQHTPSHSMSQQPFVRPQPPGIPHQSPAPSQHNLLRRDSTSSHMSQPPQQRPPNFPYTPGNMGPQHTPNQPANPGGVYGPYPHQNNPMWPSQHAAMSSPHGQQRPQHHQHPSQGQMGFQQSPHLGNMSHHGHGSPMGYPGQGMAGQGMSAQGMQGMGPGQGMAGMPQGYPQLPRGMYGHAGGGPAQGYMQQQQQHHGGMGHQMGPGQMGGMPMYAGMGVQGHPQGQQMGMGWGGGGGY